MMRRENEIFKEYSPDAICIAVTELTSTNEHIVQQEPQSKLPRRESVLNLAQLTHDAGLDGVVSSPLESQMLHEKIGPHFLTITPGIRLKENQTDDQV